MNGEGCVDVVSSDGDVGLCAGVQCPWPCCLEDGCEGDCSEEEERAEELEGALASSSSLLLTPLLLPPPLQERICGLSEHQPDTEGVLLCADYWPLHHQLLAWSVSYTVPSSPESPLPPPSSLLLPPPSSMLATPLVQCLSGAWLVRMVQ